MGAREQWSESVRDRGRNQGSEGGSNGVSSELPEGV